MHELAHGGRRALRDPFFLGALALLLVNDHVLKGSGAVPGWATGKLSDLAGMIVAPVAVVALLGVRSRLAKGLAFTAVGVLFSLLEVSPSAAAAWDRALGAIGIPSRSVADPSDLVGLAMLPLAWWLVRERSGARRESASPALQRTALALAVFACVATSRDPSPMAATWSTGAWIHNRTSGSIAVRLRWPAAELACATLSDTDLGLAIAPEILGDGITFELAPGDTVPIEPAHARAALAPPTGATPERNACDVVQISIDGVDDRIVAFDQRPIVRVATNTSSGAVVPSGGIEIREAAGVPSLLIPSDVYQSSIVVDRPSPAPGSCRDARGEGIAHGDLTVLGSEAWAVASRTLLADGCTELALVSATDAMVAQTVFLCVPGDFIPFQPGDVVALSRSTASETWLERDDGTAMVLEIGVPSVSAGGLVIGVGDVDASCAERVSCDAVVAPALLRRGGRGEAIEVGVAFDFLSEGRPARALVARAEQVVVAPASCDAGRASAAVRIDAVIVIGSTTGVM